MNTACGCPIHHHQVVCSSILPSLSPSQATPTDLQVLSVLQLSLVLSLLILQLLCLSNQVCLKDKEDTVDIHTRLSYTHTHLIVASIAVQPVRVHVDDVSADVC